MQFRQIIIPLTVTIVLGVGFVASQYDSRYGRFRWNAPKEPAREERTSTPPLVSESEVVVTLQRENERLRRDKERLEQEVAALRNSVARITEAAASAEAERIRADARRAASTPSTGAGDSVATPAAAGDASKDPPAVRAKKAMDRLAAAETDEAAASASDQVARLAKGQITEKEVENLSDDLVDLLRADANPIRRRHAARLLEQIWRKNAQIRYLAPIISKEKDDDVRISLVKVLGRTPNDRDAAPALLHTLQFDPSPEVRVVVLQCPFLDADRRLLEAVTGAMLDRDAGVRAAAAALLGRVRTQDSDQVIDALKTAISEDREIKVRRAALDALVERLGREAEQHIRALVADPMIGIDVFDYLTIFGEGPSLPVTQILEAKRAREAKRGR